MTLARRRFVGLTAAVAALPIASRIAGAQAYPTRPVRILVATAAGGSTDIAARLMATWLTDRLGQSFVVENRPGGANNIGTEAALRSPPDGYTLFMANSVNTINATFYDKLPFNFTADIAPVGGVMRSLVVMQVHPSVPAHTVAEFIANARANPGKVNMGSGGMGSTGHVAGELFQMMAGVKLTHVPYRGEAPALVDLIAGQVQVAFTTLSSSIEYLRTGKLRALAVSTKLDRPLCRMCRRSPIPWPTTRRARGAVCAPRRERRPKSSKGSIVRSMPPSPTRAFRRLSPTSAPRHSQGRPPTSARSCSPTPRNGPR